jgi:phytoene dehydrogenase-like protein
VTSPRYDVVVVGGGHNGLTAAAYLSRAGLSVLVLERLSHVGGAAVSAPPFSGQAARLSRFSYLVSLLPDAIVSDLGLGLELRSRNPSAYAPWTRSGRDGGLLVSSDEAETRASFRALTGSDDEYDAWRAFATRTDALAATIAPTLTQPLPRDTEMRALLGDDAWTDFVQQPISEVIERTFADDLVRGVVSTDAVIGTFTTPDDPSLDANRLFLHHVIGNGTGEWRVPVGGMGAVSAALFAAASSAEIVTGAGVSSITENDGGAEVTFHDGIQEHTVSARFVLANVAPWVLEILRGRPADPATKPVGSQLKINFLLSRLPALRSGADPTRALAGTLHVGQGYAELAAAHAAAARGEVPDAVPGEVYCHSLTDPSIVPEGMHTLTYFGVHTPATLFADDPAATKALAVERALAGLDAVFAEPLSGCLALDEHGQPCIEAMTPQDIEAELAMPGGHIYHGQVDWPWAGNRSALDTPAARWGVQTDSPAVLLCGAGSHRGGGVSGLGGHNAAQAVLELR